MTADDGQEARLPVGQSPRWITVHTFVGLGIGFGMLLLYGLPEAADPTIGWIFAIVPVIVLTVYARAYAWRRRTLTKVELSYLRFSIVLLMIPGLRGTLPLTLVAGPAFLIWTVVAKRHQRA